MITPQAQIKLNLPLPLKKHLEDKANKFGMPLAGYVRHLILKDVSDNDFPVYQASDKTIKAYNKALRERDKAIEIKDIDEYFKNL